MGDKKDRSTPRTKYKGILELLQATYQGEDVEWPKEELLDVLHWFKVLVAVAAGILGGVIPITGWLGLLGYTVVYFASTSFAITQLRVDPEEYDGSSVLVNDNLSVAFAMYMLSWVVSYNVVQ